MPCFVLLYQPFAPAAVVPAPPQDHGAGPSGRPYNGGRGGRAGAGPGAAAYGSPPDGYLPQGTFYVGSPTGTYGSPPGYGMPPGVYAPGPPHGPTYYPQVRLRWRGGEGRGRASRAPGCAPGPSSLPACA